MEAVHLDIIILIVLGISAAIGFLRGFTHEVFTVFGWVGAVLAVIWLTPALKPISRNMIDNTLVADVVAAAVIFLLTLAAFAIASHFAGSSVKESALGAIDRAMGFAFGLLRGLILVSLVYIALTSFKSDSMDAPKWFEEAKTRPIITASADMLVKVLPGVPSLGGDTKADKDDDSAGNLQTKDMQTPPQANALETLLAPYLQDEDTRREVENVMEDLKNDPQARDALEAGDKDALKAVIQRAYENADQRSQNANTEKDVVVPDAENRERDALDAFYQQYGQ